jgi:phosphate transport system ATP-binding protein
MNLRLVQTERAQPAEAPAALAVEGLTVRYGDHIAVRDVSLAFPTGSITALVGPSGCGKSTLLQALNRLTDLVAGCVVTGQIRWHGADVHQPAMDVQALRRGVGLIFQQPTPFPTTIRRNLTLGLRAQGLRGRSRLDARCCDVLQSVGLWDEVKDRLDGPALALSGGQQQRLCIARALALDPEVLLFDEPCSALDPLASGVVEDLIASLKGRYTVVLVSHDLAQARRLADHAALFWLEAGAGALIESGAAAAFFKAPSHAITRRYLAGERA